MDHGRERDRRAVPSAYNIVENDFLQHSEGICNVANRRATSLLFVRIKLQRPQILGSTHILLGDVDFDFRLAPGELASLVVTVATEGGNRTLELSHRIDQGRQNGRATHFQHRTSEYERQHRLRTGELGQALIWTVMQAREASEIFRGD